MEDGPPCAAVGSWVLSADMFPTIPSQNPTPWGSAGLLHAKGEPPRGEGDNRTWFFRAMTAATIRRDADRSKIAKREKVKQERKSPVQESRERRKRPFGPTAFRSLQNHPRRPRDHVAGREGSPTRVNGKGWVHKNKTGRATTVVHRGGETDPPKSLQVVRGVFRREKQQRKKTK